MYFKALHCNFKYEAQKEISASERDYHIKTNKQKKQPLPCPKKTKINTLSEWGRERESKNFKVAKTDPGPAQWHQKTQNTA